MVYESIKIALIQLFKGMYPAFDVFCEDIAKTADGSLQPVIDDYIYLDIVPAGNETISQYHTRRSFLVDAVVHTRTETNAAYYQIAHNIDAAIRPVFRFEDRAITVYELTSKVVDKVLHCTFTLSFIDSTEEPEQQPLAETLEHIERV